MWYELDKLIVGVQPFSQAVEPLTELVLRRQYPTLNTAALKRKRWQTIEWMVRRFLEERFLLEIQDFDRRSEEFEPLYHLIRQAYNEHDNLEQDFFQCIDQSLTMRRLPFQMFVHYDGSAVYLIKKK